MLAWMRSTTGGPSTRVRLLAALVVLGLLVLTAPFVMLPLLHALLGTLL